MTQIAEEVYAQCAPIAEADGAHGYATRALVRAVGSMFAQVEEAVRATGGHGPWTQAFDVDRAPVWLLPYIAQVFGLSLPPGLTAAEMVARIKEEPGWHRQRIAALEAAIRTTLAVPEWNLAANPSFEYDAIGSVPVWWTQEGAAETFTIAAGWSASGTRALRISAFVGTSATIGILSPLIAVTPGSIYTLSATAYVVTLNGCYLYSGIRFYNAKGEVVEGGAGNLSPGLGVQNIAYSQVVPAAASFIRVVIEFVNSGSGHFADMWIDKVRVNAGGKGGYGDGDQPGWRWAGTPGNSVSRGPPVAGATPVIKLTERYENKAWKMLASTAPAETPNQTLTEQVARAAAPGGIVLAFLNSTLPLASEGRRLASEVAQTAEAATLANVIF